MDETKLYICLEAKHKIGGHHQKHVYLICSLTLNDLRSAPSNSPTLTKETSFEGYPSMGCGFYQSQIVFAGGSQEQQINLENEDLVAQSDPDGLPVQLIQETDSENVDFVEQSHFELTEPTNHNGLIIFDLNSKQLSSDLFPSMLHGKLNPLVFQIQDKLYVIDTVSGYDYGSFEYFYPPKGEWNLLRQPCYNEPVYELFWQRDRNFPCFVFGNAFYLAITIQDSDLIFLHHPNLAYKSWLPAIFLSSGPPLPFSGMATFYHQTDDKFLIISLTNRVVQVHFFDLSGYTIPATKELFSLPSSSESVEDENLSGYFADFGGGIFSLTASDSVRIYVCTFQIFGPDKPTLFQLLSHYEYRFDDLSFGVDIIRVVGCFAPNLNSSAIKHAEKALRRCYNEFAERSEDDPDTFEYRGVKIEVPEGFPGSLVPVSVSTPMEPDPMWVFCALSQ